MGPGWLSCPQCQLLIPPQAGQAATRCPGCGASLTAATQTLPRSPRPVAATGPTLSRTLPAQAAEAGREPSAVVARPSQHAYELIFAFLAILAITLWYVFVVARHGAPKSSSPLGLSLGMAGFLLMLSTETIYTLRKRWRRFTLGRTSLWLRIHIFTGILGPFLVILHAAGKFHGLAGMVTLITILIVLSGFVGRFIYTAVPRTVDGAEPAVQDMEQKITGINQRLETLGRERLEAAALAAPPGGLKLVFGRAWLRWRQRRRIHRALAGVRKANPQAAHKVEQLLLERYGLLMQMQSLTVVRRLMALWHMIHVPMGVVMFTLALMHVAGALYYAVLMH